MTSPIGSEASCVVLPDDHFANIAASQCRGNSGLVPVARAIAPSLKKELLGPSRIDLRLLEAAAKDNENDSVLYQHSVLCQTVLPYRDPGDDVRRWERCNGQVHLEIEAGRAMHPVLGKIVDIGLPYGPKARMLLMHLNREAVVAQSPVINVGRSLTHFVGRYLGLSSQGRNMNTVKDQLVRLSAASIRMGMTCNGQAVTVKSGIVKAFDLWLPKDDRQRVLWPSTITLSLDYFNDLMERAVPLDEAHIAALSHNALALDIYNWLAQRLHRIPAERPQTISWLSLRKQFGQGYDPERLYNFRRVFRKALGEVLTVYRAARVEDEEAKRATRHYRNGRAYWRSDALTGLKLYQSHPPVKPLHKE